MASKVTQLNQQVDLNLDELERDQVTPFSFVLAGQRVEMTDPHEIDFKDLMEIDHPSKFLEYALSPEAKKLLLENKVPGWKFNELIDGYMKHYGLQQQAGKGWLTS